jgi:pimeloyl-ACP methyl ester carboxylesterase
MRRSGRVAVGDGVELHYVDEGDGRPLVFIHGIWASARFFDRQVADLGRRFRAIAVDLRGHGQSSMTLKDQTVAVYARDVKAFLGRMGIERPVLVGWSMGAFVIWDYVRQFGRDGIAAVVVVDQAPSDFRSPNEPDGLITVDALAAWHRRLLTDRAALMHDVIPMMFSRPPAQPVHRWMHEEMTRPPEAIAAAILVEQTFQDYRDVIDGFPIPTLVCYGESSPQPKASMRWIADAALAGEAREFAGCGHCLFLESPDEFNRAIAAFIDRVAPERPARR